MNRVVIPVQNWHTVLADAINSSTPETVIIVHNEIEKELALRAATRLGKTITVETTFEPEAEKLLADIQAHLGLEPVSDEEVLARLSGWEKEQGKE